MGMITGGINKGGKVGMVMVRGGGFLRMWLGMFWVFGLPLPSHKQYSGF